MTESKKTWVEPELIVLVRNRSEEAVLTVCKNSSSFGDVGNSAGACSTLACNYCDLYTSS